MQHHSIFSDVWTKVVIVTEPSIRESLPLHVGEVRSLADSVTASSDASTAHFMAGQCSGAVPPAAHKAAASNRGCAATCQQGLGLLPGQGEACLASVAASSEHAGQQVLCDGRPEQVRSAC